MDNTYYLNNVKLTINQEFEFVKKLSPGKVLGVIGKIIPKIHYSGFLNEINIVKTNIFDDQEKMKNYQSYYSLEEKRIYIIKEKVKSDSDLLKFIVHEIGHIFYMKFFSEQIEQEYQIIKNDCMVKQFIEEFRYARLKLYDRMERQKILKPVTNRDDMRELFANILYDSFLDYIFFDVLENKKFAKLTKGLFLTPYSALDIQENFCVMYEKYLLSENGEEEISKFSKVFCDMVKYVKYYFYND